MWLARLGVLFDENRLNHPPNPERFLGVCGKEFAEDFHEYRQLFRAWIRWDWGVWISVFVGWIFLIIPALAYLVKWFVQQPPTVGACALFFAGLFGETLVLIFVFLLAERACSQLVFRYIPSAKRSREAYRRFIWSHRSLSRAIVRFNRAHRPYLVAMS